MACLAEVFLFAWGFGPVDSPSVIYDGTWGHAEYVLAPGDGRREVRHAHSVARSV